MGNLAGAIAWLSHVLGANSSEGLGFLPAVILAVSQVLEAQATNQQRFLQSLPSAHVGIILAPAAGYGRDGIVAGCLDGQCERISKKRLWTCRSDWRSLDVKVQIAAEGVVYAAGLLWLEGPVRRRNPQGIESILTQRDWNRSRRFYQGSRH
jgi:hypothetical protein